MSKKKYAHVTGLSDLDAISAKIGKDLDNEPISLERGRYVDGCVSSNSFIIDLMMGGGIVFPGRWTTVWGPEQSGKSTLTLCTVARAIKEDIRVYLFDHEASFDPIYARNLGIRTSAKDNKGKQNPLFRYFQPTSGEKTYRYMARLLNEMPDHDPSKGSKPHALFVIDSLAAMVPEDLEMDDEKNSMAAMARLHADYMRRVKALMGRKNVSVLAVNQLREKPGMCFDYNTRVVLADGTTKRIGQIVKQKYDGEVLSFDPKTNKVVPRKIVGWFRNGYAKRFLQFKTENASGLNGYTCFAVTDNHLIFTPKGEVRAGDLREGDEILGRGQFCLNKLQRSIAYGSVLGDGSLRKQSTHKTELRIGHGPDQEDYLRWKAGIFGELATDVTPIASDRGLGFSVQPSADLLDIYDEAYPSPGKRAVPRKLLKHLDLQAIAIWYMDDGTFDPKHGKLGRGSISACWMSDEDGRKVAKKFKKLGLPKPHLSTYFYKKTGKTLKKLAWSAADFYKVQEALVPYIHPSMRYKIHSDLHSVVFADPGPQTPKYRERMIPVRVLDISDKPQGQYPHQMEKFDIEIEGTHAYMVGSGGVGVHNSFGDPRYEPGGNAVKFYPDAKLMMTAVQQPFSERGRDMRFVNLKSTKNKMFCPFRVVKEKLAIAFGRGFERGYDGLGYLQLTGQIEGGGKKYKITMEGDKKFNGDYNWDKLMELTHTNKWRTAVRQQMHSGQAFRSYMDHEGLDPEATIDVEDAGTGDRKKERDKAKKERLKAEALEAKNNKKERAEAAKNKGKKRK
jgi:recombination protein RecA